MGSEVIPTPDQASPQAHSLSGHRIPADKGIRVASYFIDLLPAMILGLFGLIPLIGAIIVGLLLTPYWLLRT